MVVFAALMLFEITLLAELAVAHHALIGLLFVMHPHVYSQQCVGAKGFVAKMALKVLVLVLVYFDVDDGYHVQIGVRPVLAQLTFVIQLQVLVQIDQAKVLVAAKRAFENLFFLVNLGVFDEFGAARKFALANLTNQILEILIAYIQISGLGQRRALFGQDRIAVLILQHDRIHKPVY